MPSILIIGSANTDMVVKTAKFPTPGQTVLGGEFFMFPGGKGANQAVAAVRLIGPDSSVAFITSLGTDIFGDQSLAGLSTAGIDTRYILRKTDMSSGVAMITVNEQGENHIVVAPGANNALLPEALDQAEDALNNADFILMQLEIPVETVIHSAEKGFELGKKIILNPAPAALLPHTIFPKIFLFTPNETEAGFYTGLTINDAESARAAAMLLLEKGVQNVVITMGEKGAFFKNADEEFMVETPKVDAVDTTAAGDVFNGALCVALLENMPWKPALELACRAAAISVTRMGAQSSAPFRGEVVTA